MFKFDRKKFFDSYRLRFGPLTQNLVDALDFILTQMENDARFGVTETDRRQLAYCLGTFKWETAHTLRPIDEIGTAARFNRIYGPQTKVGKMLGNTKDGDGALFHGRGYVQLTGRSNYAKMAALTGVDLVGSPELALDPKLAALVMFEGMKSGMFTGVGLGTYFNQVKDDPVNARRIINGTDHANDIAMIHSEFLAALRQASA